MLRRKPGFTISFALTRVLSNLLFGLETNDLLIFASVSLLLAAAAMCASYIPARKATRLTRRSHFDTNTCGNRIVGWHCNPSIIFHCFRLDRTGFCALCAFCGINRPELCR